MDGHLRLFAVLAKPDVSADAALGIDNVINGEHGGLSSLFDTLAPIWYVCHEKLDGVGGSQETVIETF